jgi:enamine deaminase RidA (YjgF/YER057c/UK114 family)
MALNWDDFCNTEILDIPNDPWSDFEQLPIAPFASEMPKSTTIEQLSRPTPGETIDFDSFLTGSSVDPYFVDDDSLFIPNDDFLGDFSTSQGFGHISGGSTTESSPEPPSATSLSKSPNKTTYLAGLARSGQMQDSVRQALQRANTACEPMLTNSATAGIIEDLTFLDGPDDMAEPSEAIVGRSKTSTSTHTKRNKNEPDILSACWTSPLCPNHKQEGLMPNPSSCGGECAPFLFADDGILPSLSDLTTKPQDMIAAEGVVQIQSRSRKRSDSNTSTTEAAGRHFLHNSTTSPVEMPQKTERDNSQDLQTNDITEVADDQKPKSRSRQPHNQVERKYRESLNTQLETLKRVVPSLQQPRAACDGVDIEDLPAPAKPSKAVILASATAHIKQIEKEKKSLAKENALLRTRVKALQALVKCDDCSLMQYVMDLKISPGT